MGGEPGELGEDGVEGWAGGGGGDGCVVAEKLDLEGVEAEVGVEGLAAAEDDAGIAEVVGEEAREGHRLAVGVAGAEELVGEVDADDAGGDLVRGGVGGEVGAEGDGDLDLDAQRGGVLG